MVARAAPVGRRNTWASILWPQLAVFANAAATRRRWAPSWMRRRSSTSRRAGRPRFRGAC